MVKLTYNVYARMKKHHAAPETKAGHGDTEEPARFLYANVTAFSEGGGIGRDGEKTGSVL